MKEIGNYSKFHCIKAYVVRYYTKLENISLSVICVQQNAQLRARNKRCAALKRELRSV